MIEISEDLYTRVVKFLQVLTNTCKGCLRPKASCGECDLATAPYLLSQMKKATSSKCSVDYGRRFDIIEAEVRAFGRPVLAKEIDPKRKLCGRGLKYWSLRKMVKLGMLRSFRKDKQVYFIVND